MKSDNGLNRRRFLRTSAAAGAAVASQLYGWCHANEGRGIKVCAFTKPFRSLSFDELADRLAAIGFQGAEVPVRAGGNIDPENVVDELPRLVEAFSARG